MTKIYLDYQATTPVDQRVLEAMWPVFCQHYGNPAQNHCFGMEAREIVTDASQNILNALGAQDGQIIFTSGATEANNIAILGFLHNVKKTAHIIMPATEHSSVLEIGNYLISQGQSVSILPSPTSGVFSIAEISAAITAETVLLSIMAVNNEIGVIQPLAEIGALCRQKGIIFHCDATQAIGHLRINMQELNIDLLSISAHKFYGPKGVGALLSLKEGLIPPHSLMHGGSQQNHLRPGTINVSGIAGMEKALLLSLTESEKESQRLRTLSQLFWQKLQAGIPNIKLNGSPNDRVHNNLNICFADVQTEALMMAVPDIAFSSAAACSGEQKKLSHVLKAIGLSDQEAAASARFSLGRFTTEKEILSAADSLIQAMQKLRPLTKVTTTEPAENIQTDELPDINEKIDLCRLNCPENYTRLLMKLEAMDTGEVLSAIVSGAEAKNNVSANLKSDGYQLLLLRSINDQHWEFIIRV